MSQTLPRKIKGLYDKQIKQVTCKGLNSLKKRRKKQAIKRFK